MSFSRGVRHFFLVSSIAIALALRLALVLPVRRFGPIAGLAEVADGLPAVVARLAVGRLTEGSRICLTQSWRLRSLG
jgi:hypothetical protein